MRSARRQLELVEPAYFGAPPYALTLGPEVCDLCTDAGFEPDPEQALALDVLFAEDEFGMPAVFEFATIAPRQNMKTGLFKQAALGWLFVTEEHDIAWSAHEFDTARESFRDIATMIENTPTLSSRLAPGVANGIFTARGSEAIELSSGARMKFKARTNGGGRGLTGDKTVLDEAFALTPQHVGAIMPILSTRPRGQILYGSSACHPNSDVLRKVVGRGRAGVGGRLGYVEYCVRCESDDCDHEPATDGCTRCEYRDCSHEPGTPGCAMDREDLWGRANTQAGRRISWQYLRDERAAMDPAEFGRERMGWHDDPVAADGTLIPADSWLKLTDPKSAPEDPISIGVHVSRDRRRAAIGVAGRRKDGRFHVEIVPAVRGDSRTSLPGTSWIAPRVAQLREQWKPSAVVIDSRSATESLLPDLEAAGPIVVTAPSEIAAACGVFHDAVVENNLRHRGEQALSRAVTGAKTRPLADSWVWDRKDPTTDITQLIAVTLALHGVAAHSEPKETEVWGFFS